MLQCTLNSSFRMLSLMNTGRKRKHKIWEAVRDGKVTTFSRLLPEATAEDLQYEPKVRTNTVYQYKFVLIGITVFLLQLNLLIQADDDWMMPALMVAARKGRLEIVQILLQSKKVDVNQKTHEVNILL